MATHSYGWYLRISAFWFATSFKWFLALLLIPNKVNQIVPVGQQNTVWGTVLGIGALQAIIGPALMGWLSDRTSTRWGRRRIWLVAGACLTSVACVVLSNAWTVPGLILGYLLLQIADDVATGPYSALIPEQVPPDQRGKASGIMGFLSSLSQIFAAGSAIAALQFDLDFGVLFGVIAALNLLAAAVVCLSLHEAPYPEVRKTPVSAEIWLSPWRSPDFRWVWVTRFLVAFGFYILTGFGQNFLKDVIQVFPPLPTEGMDQTQAALFAAVGVIVVISLTGLVGALVGGHQADRVGRKRVIQIAGWIMFAALLPFPFVGQFTWILAAAAIFGFGYGAYASADWALAADVLPSRSDIAKDMGIWQASISTPQIFNFLIGVSIDAGNRASAASPDALGTAGYTGAFLLSATAFLAGSWLVQRVSVSGPPSRGDALAGGGAS